MINPKYVLVNAIEERLNITLTNEQLAYIFSEDQELVMTTPRRYGKDLITAIKIAVHLILKDNHKIGVLCYSKDKAKLVHQQVKEILELLNANNQIRFCSKNPYRILMNNNSQVNMFSSDAEIRGHRLDEAYIIEFLHRQGMNDAFNRVLMLLLHNRDYRLNIIGTPTISISIEGILNRSNIRHIAVEGTMQHFNSTAISEELPEFARPGEMIFNARTNEYYIANQFGELVCCNLQ